MVEFENATLIKPPYVVINGVEYEVHPAEYSGGTVVSAENMNKVQTDLEDQINCKYIIATISTQQNLGSETKINLNQIYKNIGNKFSLTNNNIIVGSGVSKVRVCGAIFIEGPQGTGYIWGQIRINNATVSSCICPYNNAGGYLTTPIPPTIVEVQEGDVISLTGDSTCQGSTRTGRGNTWVLVEAIDY